MTVYTWVHTPGGTLYNVGILEDGTLHNPRGYPDDVVREAVEAANERRRHRRREAAKKAAATRRKRRDRAVYEAAARLRSDGRLSPANNCAICGKALDDPDSVQRGIGSDCWQAVLAALGERVASGGAP